MSQSRVLLDYWITIYNWMIQKSKSPGIIAMMDHDDGDREAIKIATPVNCHNDCINILHQPSTPFHQSFTLPVHSSGT